MTRKFVILPIFLLSALLTQTGSSFGLDRFQNDVVTTPNLTGVTVAVIDTGLDSNKQNISKSQLLKGYSFVPSAVTLDTLGHGSVVSSIIADPRAGGSSKIKILPLKVYNNDVSTSADTTARAIDYAVKNKVKVISVSLGGPDNSQTLTNSVYNAQAKGSIIVASSGNEGSSAPLYPASISGVVSVGGIGRDYKYWSLSNRSPNLMFVAPSDALNFYGNLIDGTSFAAPQVAKVLAMLVANYPKKSTLEILNAAKTSALDLDAPGRDDRSGYGLIDYSGASLILSGKMPSKGTLTQSVENINGKTSIRSLTRTATGQPIGGVTLNHYAYLQTYQQNIFLGSSVTDAVGSAQFDVNIFGNGTLWSRTSANDSLLAMASNPLDFSGMSGLVNYENSGKTILVTNSNKEPVVGYGLPVWEAVESNWLSFDTILSNSRGEVKLDSAQTSYMLSYGTIPKIEIPVTQYTGGVKFKAILCSLGTRPNISLLVTTLAGKPLAGFQINANGRTFLTNSDGYLLTDGSKLNFTYIDPSSKALKTFNFAPKYPTLTHNTNAWDINVSYSTKAVNGKANIQAKVNNPGGSLPAMKVDLEMLVNGSWVTTISTTSSKGIANFSRSISGAGTTFRVTAHTPDGLLTTNSFTINR